MLKLLNILGAGVSFRRRGLVMIIGVVLSTIHPLPQGSGDSNSRFAIVTEAFAQGSTIQNIVPERGFTYIAPQDLRTSPDTGQSPVLSTVRLFENGRELGPAHVPHADIRNLGMGRFSHWGSTDGTTVLYFSASDNTNPNTNGRIYTYSIGSQPTPGLPVPPPTALPVLATNIRANGGYGYSAFQNFGTVPDTQLAPTISAVRLFENGRELGPAHARHTDIRNFGMGQFSHWGSSDGTSALYFSTSDNTDPSTNGRVYTYRLDSLPAPSPPPPDQTPAPAPDAQNPLKTDFGVYPEPSLPTMGPAGSHVVDPTFGTTILRVTDGTDGSSDCMAPYFYYPLLNVNNTRVYTVCYYPKNAAVFYTLDAVNFTIAGRHSASDPPDGGDMFWYDMVWSGSDPNIIYGHGYTDLWAYNPATDSYSRLRNFAADVSATGATYLDQMSASRNDDVFGFSLANSAGNHFGYLVWKRSTNQILLNRVDDKANEIQVDKSGQYITVQRTDGNAQVWNLSTGTLVAQTAEGVDGFYHADTGMGTVFSSDGSGKGLAIRNLATPHALTVLFPGYFPFINMGYSMNADNGRWALVFTQRNDSNVAGKPFENELVQVATDGSNRVRRIAHHRSRWNDYNDQPNANMSRDGQFVAFSSNWGNASGRRDVYLVRLAPAPAQ